MAISTYKTYLMQEGSSPDQWTKVVDIKDFPALGGEPEMLETTTLSDNMQTYIPGIQSLEALTFTCNYDVDDFETLKALEGQDKHYAVWFGATGEGTAATPDGSRGKFDFNGQLSVYVDAGEVNAVVNMIVTIAPSTPISFTGPTE